MQCIVDFPIKHGDCPVRYVELPEGTTFLGHHSHIPRMEFSIIQT